ncbi:GlxA family transcriptional regulator [Ruegeria lacuscaerulensis]|uniref:GlxA family transcriptional regulator n=1 Tax=Ruegeria lacuscaerulensis TaxID=55218 RepID=UPI0014814CB8|nr:GlxA family transcriptional regulator [Ruegeria lacuscaerulensis]
MKSFNFVLVPGYNLSTMSLGIETLRVANRMAGGDGQFTWNICAESGSKVESSSGLEVSVDYRLREAPDTDYIVICASLNLPDRPSTELANFIRQAVRKGQKICAVGAGTMLLAQCGVLNDRRCTIHWENKPSLIESCPDVLACDGVFEIDRNFMTCGGGVSSLDLFLKIVEDQMGALISARTADQLLYQEIRAADEKQKTVELNLAAGIAPYVARAIDLMKENIEHPLSISEIGDRLRISQRQLERQFHKAFGETPTKYYRRTRIRRSKTLISETTLPVSEISVACGFSSKSNFDRAFAEFYGISPTRYRKSKHL